MSIFLGIYYSNLFPPNESYSLGRADNPSPTLSSVSPSVDRQGFMVSMVLDPLGFTLADG